MTVHTAMPFAVILMSSNDDDGNTCWTFKNINPKLFIKISSHYWFIIHKYLFIYESIYEWIFIVVFCLMIILFCDAFNMNPDKKRINVINVFHLVIDVFFKEWWKQFKGQFNLIILFKWIIFLFSLFIWPVIKITNFEDIIFYILCLLTILN